MRRLTQKQETFCLNILKGMGQRKAYIEAGYSTNMPLSVIDVKASELANNGKVSVRIKELRQATEDAIVATVIERKQVLTEILRGRFAEFFGKDISELTPEDLKTAALQEIKITEFTGGKDSRAKEKTTTIKLHSPIQAIAELNKMERIYDAVGSVVIDNRTLIINVTSDKAKNLTERLIEGERTD